MRQERCPLPKGLIRFLACGFGSGLIPFAPGTMGTLAAIPIAWGVNLLSPATNAVITLVAITGGALICGAAASQSGSKDPGWIVIDEMAGFLVAVMWLEPSVISYTAAFFLFRLFDIIKPPPANWLDRWDGGGWSIMLDDVAAGIMTRLVLAAGIAFWHP